MPETTAVPVLALRGVTALAPDGTTLLDDVSFTAERGSLVAVVGPTGAGKTSLARALTGALPIASGDVHVEGSTAFVPQHDVLHLGLSLRRAMAYAASLRLPHENENERSARVTQVMRELGLESHADTVVRDLSVGQRKRASVAAQLLGNPDVIVLDEPTAGLDPGYERVVMNMLRDLAAAGRTILIVTHAVDSLRACDRVLFLAAGGSVAFYGPPAQAAKYFKLSDPADVFIELDQQPHKTWKESFKSSALYEKYVAAPARAIAEVPPAKQIREGFGLRQISMLVRRHFDLLRGDRRHLAMLALQAPVIGVLLWSVLPVRGLQPEQDGTYTNHAAVVVMFLVLSVTWLGVTNAIREIVKDRDIVRSEVPAGLSARSYVTSKAFGVGAMTVAQSTVIAFIATLRQHATGSGAFLWSARVELIFIAAVVGLAAATLGLALSSLAKSADKALAFLPMTLVLQLVLAGAWAQDSSLFVLRQIRSLMGARWGMDAMAATLQHSPGKFFTSVGALFGLVGLGMAVAALRVAHTTRPATNPLPSPRDLVGNVGRQVRNAGIGVATAVSIAASLAAGGTGVVAMVNANANHDAAADKAAVAAPKPNKGATTKTTVTTAPTEVTTPTTVAVVEVPVTTPTTAAVRKQPVKEVVTDLTDTVNNVVQPVGDVLQDVLTPPTTVPVTTPTTTPVAAKPTTNIFNFWKVFLPGMNR